MDVVVVMIAIHFNGLRVSFRRRTRWPTLKSWFLARRRRRLRLRRQPAETGTARHHDIQREAERRSVAKPTGIRTDYIDPFGLILVRLLCVRWLVRRFLPPLLLAPNTQPATHWMRRRRLKTRAERRLKTDKTTTMMMERFLSLTHSLFAPVS